MKVSNDSGITVDPETIAGIVSDVREQGFHVAESVLSEEETTFYRTKMEAVLTKRMARGEYCGNEVYQVLYTYFKDDLDLIGLVDHPVIDAVMSELIDQDWVLISPSARNRRADAQYDTGNVTSGEGWHTDTRYTSDGVTAFRPSSIYYAVIMLDEFSVENGGTHVVPGSHKWYRRPESRTMEIEYEVVTACEGSIMFFDSALWHRVGPANGQSRWGVFHMCGPWYIKPYFRFQDLFSDEEVDGLSPVARQALHFDSIPPLDHNEGLATLRRVREEIASQNRKD